MSFRSHVSQQQNMSMFLVIRVVRTTSILGKTERALLNQMDGRALRRELGKNFTENPFCLAEQFFRDELLRVHSRHVFASILVEALFVEAVA